MYCGTDRYNLIGIKAKAFVDISQKRVILYARIFKQNVQKRKQNILLDMLLYFTDKKYFRYKQ